MSVEEAGFYVLKSRAGEAKEDYFNLVHPQAQVILKSAVMLE